MSEDFAQGLLKKTEELLRCIRERDWESYKRLCSSDLTCFEPETRGSRVAGLDFHRFYFENGGHMGHHQDTICDFQVRSLGPEAALVTYVRLIQTSDLQGSSQTHRYAETRVWERVDGQWKHVHFHRSEG